MPIKNSRIRAVFARLEGLYPTPQTELEYSSTYTLLIAVLLSAQTTDKQVNKCTRKLFALASTPEEMLQLPLEIIQDSISSLGLYRQKAKHVLATSKRLVDVYEGQVPASREALETLPGVGRKTANVVLNVAFQQPTIPVDTHVFRMARRLGLSAGTTPLRVEQDLEGLVHHAPSPVHVHHWLILHGRYVCTARRPQCTTCALADICPKLHS